MKSHALGWVARLAGTLSAAVIAVWCLAGVAAAAPATTQDFEAFVGDDVAGDGRPGFVVVSSNEVPVTWWQFVIINPWGAQRR